MRRIAITGVVLLGALTALATPTQFQGTFQRYLRGHDLFRVLAQKFPRAKVDLTCKALTDKTRNLLGGANPADGELPYQAPSPAFVKWYSKCLLQYVTTDLKATVRYPAELARYFGPEAMKASGKEMDLARHAPGDVPWGQLPEAMRTGIVRHLVARLIGPGVVRDETKLVKSVGTALDEKNSTEAALRLAVFFIATQEEFLTY